MKTLALLATCVTFVGGCGKPAEPVASAQTRPIKSMSQSPTTHPADRFTGTLRGGVIAVGAETTGWVLETQPGKRFDVDVSKVADVAANLDGKRVIVIGTMTIANWVESGQKPLLIADQIEPADAAE